MWPGYKAKAALILALRLSSFATSQAFYLQYKFLAFHHFSVAVRGLGNKATQYTTYASSVCGDVSCLIPFSPWVSSVCLLHKANNLW